MLPRRFAVRIIPFVVVTSIPVGAVTVFNGSFENVDSSYSNSAGIDQMHMGVAPGWTPTDTPDWFWGEGPENLWDTPFGDFFTLGAAADVYREGVTQTITGFTVGLDYDLHFSQANGLYFISSEYFGVNIVGGWEVLINGVSLGYYDSANGNSVPTLDFTAGWLDRTVTFAATAETMDLTFLAFRNPQQMVQDPTFQFLDNVSISGVPEPSVSLLAAVAALSVLRRRR